MHAVGATAEDGVTGSMVMGSWSRWGDTPGAGPVAVLLDAVLARACLLEAGARHRWLTRELSIDVCGALPHAAEVVASSGRVSMAGSESIAMASARLGDTLLAVASSRGQVLPGTTEPERGEGRLIGSLGELLVPTDAPGAFRVPPHPGVTNQQGLLHGGVAACIAEGAAMKVLAGDAPYVTAGLRVVYLRPLPIVDGGVTVRARAGHRGRTLGLAHVEIVRPDGRVGAVATVTASA